MRKHNVFEPKDYRRFQGVPSARECMLQLVHSATIPSAPELDPLETFVSIEHLCQFKQPL
jgi:hypothetical protein